MIRNTILFFLLINLLFCSCIHNTPNNHISVLMKPRKAGDVLDPAKVRLSDCYFYLENMTIRLVELLKNGEYKNQLAEKFEFKNDRKDIHITIKDAYFSDGTKITADDVINTLKRIIITGSPHTDPRNFIRGANHLKKITDNIEGLQKIDEKKFILGLHNPMKELFYYLQLADYGILHRTQYEKELLYFEDWTKVVSGPYYFNQEGILIANPKALNYHDKMPIEVVPNYISGQDLVAQIKNSTMHAGHIKFQDFLNFSNELKNIKHISIFGGVGGGIVTLTLNVNANKFKSDKTRQWLQKKILTSFTIEDSKKDFMAKAYQFFLPEAKGFVKESQTLELLNNVNLDQIPNELKMGINIRTLETMTGYVPAGFDQILTETLGIPVTIKYDIPSKDYFQALHERDFEIFMIASSMSYKVLGEALNLKYLSENPLWLDPTGAVKELLKSYQATDNLQYEAELIHKILKTMIIDSECIPLFYIADPTFYNHDRFDMKDLHVEESFQFWRLRVKK